MELEKYNENLSYSYIFGAFGTIELIKSRPNECLACLIDPSFKTNKAYNTLKSLTTRFNIPLIVDKAKLDRIKDKGNIYVVGAFKKQIHAINKENNHVVICNLDDIGCIGTIIRSMVGFNFKDLVLVNCNVDIYAYHLVRSTMGAYFKVNISTYNNLEEYIRDNQNRDYYSINNHEGAKISKINSKKCSLIFNIKENYNNLINNISFREDISLDNIVNIVLFSLNK